MADGRDRFVGGEERLDEVDGVLIQTQGIGVEGAAGQNEGVEVIDRGLGDGNVDVEGLRVLPIAFHRLQSPL